MKALVIGGTGFIGRRLVRNLLEENDEVTIATRGKTQNPFKGEVKEIVFDRFDEESIRSSIPEGEHYDVVYDQVGFGPDDVSKTVNALEGKTDRYVYTSSLAVYGESGTSMTEDEFDPKSHEMKDGGIGNLGYSEGKRSAETYLFNHATFPVAAARFPIVVGPDDVTSRLQFHMDRIMNESEIVIPLPAGKTNFVWVEDAGRFLSWLGHNKKEGPYNPASRQQIDARAMVNGLATAVGKFPDIKEAGADENKSPYHVERDWTISVSKAEGEGFRFTPVEEWIPKVAKEAAETKGKQHNSMDYLKDKLSAAR